LEIRNCKLDILFQLPLSKPQLLCSSDYSICLKLWNYSTNKGKSQGYNLQVIIYDSRHAPAWLSRKGRAIPAGKSNGVSSAARTPIGNFPLLFNFKRNRHGFAYFLAAGFYGRRNGLCRSVQAHTGRIHGIWERPRIPAR